MAKSTIAKQLVNQAHSLGAPLLSPEAATFVWQGKKPAELVGDFNDWEEDQPLEMKLAGPGVWTASVPLPADAYLEYVYFQNGRRILDPLNPNRVSNGVGAENNFFYMPEAVPTPLAHKERGVPHGEVTLHYLDPHDLLPGGSRRLYLYHPPVDGAPESPPEGPVPLLVVWDGPDYLHRASLANIVDNLIHQNRIQPIAMALIDNGRSARVTEYACSEAPLMFLVDCVLPLCQEELDLIDIQQSPGSYGVLGASMGGLMALYTALRLPHIFGRVLSQSGSFSLHYETSHDLVVYDLVRKKNRRLLKIWMDVGNFEWLLETNRRMHGLLEEKGFDVTYREFNAGHNYSAWREDVWRGLEALFPLG